MYVYGTEQLLKRTERRIELVENSLSITFVLQNAGRRETLLFCHLGFVVVGLVGPGGRGWRVRGQARHGEVLVR